MKRTNRFLSSCITVERKDGKIEVQIPGTDYKETFTTEDEAIETLIYWWLELQRQIGYNIIDKLREKPEKLEIDIKSSVKSEIN